MFTLSPLTWLTWLPTVDVVASSADPAAAGMSFFDLLIVLTKQMVSTFYKNTIEFKQGYTRDLP